jgi:hypothetical protein
VLLQEEKLRPRLVQQVPIELPRFMGSTLLTVRVRINRAEIFKRRSKSAAIGG